MKKVIATLTLGAAISLTGSALAQDFPKWPIGAACSAGDDACPRFEQRSRGEISGVWGTLPPDVRAACISETEEIEKSYRLLSDCLANKMQALMRGQTQRS